MLAQLQRHGRQVRLLIGKFVNLSMMYLKDPKIPFLDSVCLRPLGSHRWTSICTVQLLCASTVLALWDAAQNIWSSFFRAYKCSHIYEFIFATTGYETFLKLVELGREDLDWLIYNAYKYIDA